MLDDVPKFGYLALEDDEDYDDEDETHLCDWWPPSGEGGSRSFNKDATNSQSGPGERFRGGAQASDPDAPPGTTEWNGDGRPVHLLNQHTGKSTPWNRVPADSRVLNLRHRTALAAAGLVHDVEPNPGPSARGRRSRGEVRVNRRRLGRRVRRRLARGPGPGGRAVRVVRDGCERVVVTWNVQGLSLREGNRERLLRVLERVRLNGWEIVCLTELRAESSGVL